LARAQAHTGPKQSEVSHSATVTTEQRDTAVAPKELGDF
jgi:hypothetical protein